MKRNYIIIVISVLLVFIFGLWLCCFQVRTTEVAVRTRFGKPIASLTNAGLYVKWPPPIERIYKFDNRVQSSEVENKVREDLTSDNYPLLTSVYVGWQITDPEVFLRKYPGGVLAIEQPLASLVSSVKSGVVGKHPLSDFISANGGGSKFQAIEDQILSAVQTQIQQNDYGISVEFLGFKRIGLPEDTTQKVFDRMTSERNVLISKAQHEGEAQAQIIRSDADLQAAKVLAAAQGEALQIQGQGELAATKYLSEFEREPQLASFLFQLNALEDSLKDRTTLILDQQTTPFTLFNGPLTNLPAK